MADGQLIEFDHASKRFGTVAAVSDFSARVRPGVVTGFLGPNGAGKTTTLRMLLGLERPTSGSATIGGSRYAELRSPARVIGAMLEDPGFRVRRTVERHLLATAKAGGVPPSRVGELISFVGLGDDADTRIAALSLGMRQRLSAATALLGDPGVLVLDEPANGLDPEGIRWMRTLIRGLADEGRTVLVSSHVLSEVEQIADEILVIARGELKFAGTMEALADPRTGPVVVDAADRRALSAALAEAGYEFEILRSGLTVRGSDAATIGGVTARAGIALTTLQQRGPTLEDVFLDLVHGRHVQSAPRIEPVIAAPPAEQTESLPEAVAPPAAPLDHLADGASRPADDPASADSVEWLPESVGSLPESVEGSALHVPTEERSAETAPDEVHEPSAPDSLDDLAALLSENAPDDDASGESASEAPDAAEPETDLPTGGDEADVLSDGTDISDGTDGTHEQHAAPTSSERVEPTAKVEEERRLPGLSDLGLVASLFSTRTDDSEDGDRDGDAASSSSGENEDDLEATRVIDVVPAAEGTDDRAPDHH